MYNNISPFISAYKKNYNTEHVVIRLLEGWRENLDKNYVVGGVLMDLSKDFDCVPHDLLLAKLAAYGVDKNLLCYIYSYLLNLLSNSCESIISIANFWMLCQMSHKDL